MSSSEFETLSKPSLEQSNQDQRSLSYILAAEVLANPAKYESGKEEEATPTREDILNMATAFQATGMSEVYEEDDDSEEEAVFWSPDYVFKQDVTFNFANTSTILGEDQSIQMEGLEISEACTPIL